MGDPQVNALLIEWGLEDYITTFESKYNLLKFLS